LRSRPFLSYRGASLRFDEAEPIGDASGYLDEEIGGISVADRRRSSDSLAGRLRECGKRRGDRELVLAFVGDPAGDRGNESLLGRDLDCPAPRPALRSVIKSE
jgi:hypothetical protein